MANLLIVNLCALPACQQAGASLRATHIFEYSRVNLLHS